MSRACTKCGKNERKSAASTVPGYDKSIDCDCGQNRESVAGGDGAARYCMKCNLRLPAKSRGRMTQWVFSESMCRCKEPEPNVSLNQTQSGRQRTLTAELATSTRVAEEQAAAAGEEEELENLPSAFPRGRYRALLELGKGANGIVYLCRDKFLGKKVALKMCQSSDRETVIDFQREAKIISSLSHPGIVRVLDFGADDGQPYLVMDFVRGRNLKDYVRINGPFSLERFKRIARGLVDAVDYAHSHEIIHRDLKPANIILPEDEVSPAVILDFGLARGQTINSNTMKGTVIGTPLYMSPEASRGELTDWRADIYSLGCVFYFMLTGRPPLTDKEFQHCMLETPDEEPFPISNPTAEPGLNRIVLSMLERDRELRLSSLKTVAAFLDQMETAEAIQQTAAIARPAIDAGVERRKKFSLSSKQMIIAVTAMALLVVLAFGVLGVIDEFGSSAKTAVVSAKAATAGGLRGRGEPKFAIDETVYCNERGNWEKVRIYRHDHGKYEVEFLNTLDVPGSVNLWVAEDRLSRQAK